MPEIVFKGKEYVCNHHLTVPYLTGGSASRVVLLETKGAHLAGNNDTGYKQALLAQLTEAYCDERFRSSGELSLEQGEGGQAGLECDLVFDAAWTAAMDSRHFPKAA